jgi:hypothetical protein
MPEAPQIALEGGPLLNIHLRALTEGIAGNGVVASTDLEVTAGSGDLDIDVAAGDVYLDGTQYSYGGGTSAAMLSAGDGTYDRYDTVAFDTGTTSVVVHEGTPAQYPTAPDIQAGEVALAVVYVASGATAIDGGDITNVRALYDADAAANVSYADSTGAYGVSDVAAALDELQEAAQAGAYPFGNSDLANSTVTVAGNSVGLGGSTAVAYVDLSDTGTSFPIPNADLSNSAVTVAGNSVSLGGSTTIAHGDLSTAPTAAHHTPPGSDTATASGDGSTTTFTLSHSLGSTPTAVSVEPTSADAAGEFYVSSKTSTDVDVTYSSAPADGTDNLTWDIITVV